MNFEYDKIIKESKNNCVFFNNLKDFFYHFLSQAS